MHLQPLHYAMLAVLAGFAIYQYLPKIKTLLRSFQGELQENKNATEPSAQRWAILTGAILAERNSQYLNSLATGLDKRAVQESLHEWWGIISQHTALETLTWLQEEGHRQQYTVVSRIIRDYPQSEWEKAATEMDSTGQLYEKLLNLFNGMLALKKDNLLTPGDFNRLSILSWDFARLINNCRWCFEAKYLSEEEAWSLIMPAAKALQQEYQSWEDLAKAYLLGRVMWGGGTEPDSTSDYSLLVSISKTLLESEKSPWKTTPWNTALT